LKTIASQQESEPGAIAKSAGDSNPDTSAEHDQQKRDTKDMASSERSSKRMMAI